MKFEILVEYNDGYASFIEGWVVDAPFGTKESALETVQLKIAKLNAISILLFDIPHWRVIND